jgi:hypothetical protein
MEKYYSRKCNEPNDKLFPFTPFGVLVICESFLLPFGSQLRLMIATFKLIEVKYSSCFKN